MKADHICSWITYSLYTAAAVLIIVLSICYPYATHAHFFDTDADMQNTGWYYEKDNAKVYVSLPCRIPENTRGVSELYHELPFGKNDDYIGFYSLHQNISIVTDGIVIYQYKFENVPSWLKTSHRYFHIVQIPSGKNRICIKTFSYSIHKKGFYGDVYTGSQSSIIFSFIKINKVKFLLAFCIIILGSVLCFVSGIFRKDSGSKNLLFALGILAVFTGLWEIADSQVLQIWTENPFVHWGIEYLILMLLPLSIVQLVKAFNAGLPVLNFALFCIDVGIIVFQLIMQFAGISALTNTMILTHLFLIFMCIYAMVMIVRSYAKGNEQVQIYIASIVVLAVGIVGQVIYYYLSDQASSISISAALLCFFIIFGINSYQMASLKLLELNKTEDYHRLAFTDFATGSYSRTAYFTFVETYNPVQDDNAEYCAILFDMNNLKYINDRYGHLAGDQAIKSFYTCAEEAFGIYGKIYRIGGDEFICLCRNVFSAEVVTACDLFEKYVASQKSSPLSFSVAYGYAYFKPKNKDDFYAAQETADKNMYKMKSRMKTMLV